MNILIVNHYAGSPDLGMEYRHYYLAREWQKTGNRVLIVAASFSHLRSKQLPIEKDFIQLDVEGISYIIIRTPAYSGNGKDRIINMFTFVRRLYQDEKWLPVEFKPDIIIASSTHHLEIFPLRKLAKKTAAKLILEIRDLWPLSPMELGGFSKYHPFIMVIQYAENFAYRHSCAVISALPKAIDYMKDHGVSPERFFYVPNGINSEDWQTNTALPEIHRSFIQTQKDQNRFLICYAGNIGISNALQTFVKAAPKIMDERIVFLIVGNGPEKENLIRLSLKLNLKNLFFLEAVPKRYIPGVLTLVDALFLGWQRSALYRFGISPNKLMDYMMAAKPIIHAVEAGNDLVKEAVCGISVEPENPEDVAEAVMKLYRMNPSERERLGRNGKEYVIKNYDYRVLAQKFLDILIQV